ncbi:hypothetical protein O0I10_004356 [Lichtheimia ornata]|uniref:Yeast cell wall synthesis Kre9/Knh1-like N-terminal domain-containing protein n=1 Tax=Lichtheimia ornata TaxID=688661 RepID=A0AAD7V5J5_9FUNG|nr:uncharacterized protein O0I10_004356 [Lichtheimia ornata]KAJ8659763.1 hypothetical protein O0I10_004356 [Lichtheimia ornata]
MKFTTAIISAALVALASAQGAQPAAGGAQPAAGGGGGGAIVSITSPLTGTVYKAGTKARITWINPKVDTIPKIALARGPSTALQPVAQIAQNVNAATGSYEWDIPQDCENGKDYAFEIGESPNLAFAGPFTLEGCSGGGFSSSGAAASGASGSSPAAPAGSSGSSPAASGSSSGATPASSSSSHSGSSSSPASAEGAAGQVNPGAAVAILGGLAAVYQLF